MNCKDDFWGRLIVTYPGNVRNVGSEIADYFLVNLVRSREFVT